MSDPQFILSREQEKETKETTFKVFLFNRVLYLCIIRFAIFIDTGVTKLELAASIPEYILILACCCFKRNAIDNKEIWLVFTRVLTIFMVMSVWFQMSCHIVDCQFIERYIAMTMIFDLLLLLVNALAFLEPVFTWVSFFYKDPDRIITSRAILYFLDVLLSLLVLVYINEGYREK